MKVRVESGFGNAGITGRIAVQIFLLLISIIGLFSCNQNLPAAKHAQVTKDDVLALLGPEERDVAERDISIQKLKAKKLQWQGIPAAELVAYARLAAYFSAEGFPDSAYYYLHAADKAAQNIPKNFKLEHSQVLNELALYHWERLSADSALHYYLVSANVIEAAGYNLASSEQVAPLVGWKVVPGGLLANKYSNASLVYRRRGDLTTAVNFKEKALKLYRQINDPDGLRWTQSLLGQDYESLENLGKAQYYYDLALKTARSQRAINHRYATVQFAEVLGYSHDVLISQKQANKLLKLIREGLGMWQLSAPVFPNRTDLPVAAADLYLMQAKAYIGLGHADSAQVSLNEAEQVLQNLEKLNSIEPGQKTAYYEKEFQSQLLQAELAALSGQNKVIQSKISRCLALLDSVQLPASRVQLQEKLGRFLLQQNQFSQAIVQLLPLTGVYREQDAKLKLRSLYGLLQRAYAGNRAFEEAYRYSGLYRDLQDSLQNLQQFAMLANMETRYQTREKENQIQALTAEAARKEKMQAAAWVGAALLSVLLFLLGLAYRKTRLLNKELLEAGEARTKFFANVSHELRTPLSLIIGPLHQFLQHEVSLSAAGKKRLELSLKHANRLQKLINQLLLVLRNQATRPDIKSVVFSFASFAHDLVDSFEELAAKKNINLRLEKWVPNALEIKADREKLEQIAVNLVANALHFTPPNGTVLLKISASGKDMFLLEVADSGSGIAEAELEKIFERFYQSPANAISGGTGIGLALSRELAQMIGGTLTVENSGNSGAVFTLAFPAVALPGPANIATNENLETDKLETETIDAQTVANLPENTRTTILLAEDTADFREFMAELLQPEFDVVEAPDGKMALHLLKSLKPDLIICDEMMPGLTGTEVLQKLKSNPATAGIPFLMVTARADDMHKQASLQLGVDDYLEKPFLPDELLIRVKNLLHNARERHQYLTETETVPVFPEYLPYSDKLSDSVDRHSLAEPEVLTVPEHNGIADQQLLQKLKQIIENELANPDLDIARLAALSGLGERTLFRRLKQLTGLSPAAFVKEIRLESARRLLESRSVKTIAEAAYLTGFSDPAYFSKLIYSRYGKRPGDFLKNQ